VKDARQRRALPLTAELLQLSPAHPTALFVALHTRRTRRTNLNSLATLCAALLWNDGRTTVVRRHENDTAADPS